MAGHGSTNATRTDDVFVHIQFLKRPMRASNSCGQEKNDMAPGRFHNLGREVQLGHGLTNFCQRLGIPTRQNNRHGQLPLHCGIDVQLLLITYRTRMRSFTT